MGPRYFWWGGMWIFPLIMIIVLYLIFGRGGFRPPWQDHENYFRGRKDTETALDILKKRYAKSEISKEEFEQMKKTLQVKEGWKMETHISQKDKDRIELGIQDKYEKVADSPEGLFKYPTGRSGLETLEYDSRLIEMLPDTVIASYCGVGNPFSIGPINEGDAVLDIGCGAGVDTLLAGVMVGAKGTVEGVDLTAEMLQRAKANLALTVLNNVKFKNASGEKLPFEDSSFDVVISNGVINLIPYKTTALKEALRVLKPGGRLMIADQILKGPLKTDKRERIDKWAQWEGGSIPGKDFLALLLQAGFINVELVAKTGFNSSLKTMGALFKAKKPLSPK